MPATCAAALFAALMVGAATATLPSSTGGAPKPHIVFILLDDFGWADAGWHREAGYKEVQTPVMNSLVANGIELDQHYAFKFCSPSRCALQSGRNPIHVNVQNLNPDSYNPDDPVSGFSGIPRNVTGMAEKLREQGYVTHAYGKWDAGMATHDHTPFGRGYDEAVNYYHHDNSYWDSRVQPCKGTDDAGGDDSKGPRDLWCYNRTEGGPCVKSGGHPATMLVNADHCEPAGNAPFPNGTSGDGCQYEDLLFSNLAVSAVERHDPSNPDTPLFLAFLAHTVHTPLQVPEASVDAFGFIDDHDRSIYHAMVNYIDTQIGRIESALKAKGMWDNTLIVLSSDNGGPVYCNPNNKTGTQGCAGANNYPLRGGKASNWQGGVRVNAFVSGGFVPEAMRGKKLGGLAALWDWYGVFVKLAGGNVTDARAAAAGLPPVDSVDLWPYLSGQTAVSPRTQLPIGSTAGYRDVWGSTPDAIVQAIVVAEPSDDAGVPQAETVGAGNGSAAANGEPQLWKLMLGESPMNGWQGPQYPNVTDTWNAGAAWGECGSGCLFDLTRDPNETTDLAKQMPAKVQELMSKLVAANATTFSPRRGPPDPAACDIAKNRYNDTWGPFIFP